MQASQSRAAHRAMQRTGQQRWLAPCSSCAGRRTRRRAGRAGQPLSMPRWPCLERCWGRSQAALAWTGRRRRPPDAAGTRCCLATTTAAARPAPPACGCCRASEGSGLLGLGKERGVQAGRQAGRWAGGRGVPAPCQRPRLPATAAGGCEQRCRSALPHPRRRPARCHCRPCCFRHTEPQSSARTLPPSTLRQ